jgi:serine/threonine protein phosphatase PrpC
VRVAVSEVFAYRSGSVCHVGRVREVNEDSVLTLPAVGLWAVSDGMGGYGNGDIASRAVVDALEGLEPNESAARLLAEFEQKIIGVNADLRMLARARRRRIIGATLVALIVHGSHYASVWCGDSRTYLLRDKSLKQITRDHSEVQELVDQGVLSREEARSWAGRNVITRALGATDRAELEIVDGAVHAGDRFLLCSDGLVTHASDDEIAALLAGDDPQEVCDKLLTLTLSRGASDNVSIVIVDCLPG